MHGICKEGFPWTSIEITGNTETIQKVEVIIDTGFNGYLMLPYTTAFPIGLTLENIESGKVADGSFSPYISCLGTVLYANKRILTPIDVQENSRPLLGMALLKEMGCKVTVDPIKEKVVLEQIR